MLFELEKLTLENIRFNLKALTGLSLEFYLKDKNLTQKTFINNVNSYYNLFKT